MAAKTDTDYQQRFPEGSHDNNYRLTGLAEYELPTSENG